MPHVFERAPSGRAKCRACLRPIAKGELRFGERLPNPFGEGERSLWYHPPCAAFVRPEPLLETLADPATPDSPAPEELAAHARAGVEHRRLPRLRAAERAPSGRARCRECREPIAKDGWRLTLAWYEEGRFEPSGFLHPGCAPRYFGTPELSARLALFSDRTPEELAEVEAEIRAGAAS